MEWGQQGQRAPSCLFPAHHGMHPSFQRFLLPYPEHPCSLHAIRLLRASTHRRKILNVKNKGGLKQKMYLFFLSFTGFI